jgi:hypothetical protein
MGIGQDQLRVPFVERLHLLGAAEADEVLLEPEPGFQADMLLFDIDRNPAPFAERLQDLGCRHEGVSGTEAGHRAGGEDARRLGAQIVHGEGLRLEVGRRRPGGMCLHDDSWIAAIRGWVPTPLGYGWSKPGTGSASVPRRRHAFDFRWTGGEGFGVGDPEVNRMLRCDAGS